MIGLLCLGILLFFTRRTNAYEQEVLDFCSTVMRESGAIQNGSRQCACKPGKRGPIGVPGIKGEKGAKGDITDSSRLMEKLESLEAKLRLMSKTPEIALHFCSMGMKSGGIPDSSITTSSDHNAQHLGKYARLDLLPSGGHVGSWCPLKTILGEWLQVDLGAPRSIGAIVTQGRYTPSGTQYWIGTYKVACGNITQFLPIIQEGGEEKVFRGNTDMTTKVINWLREPVTCRYVRIYPRSWNSFMCFRMEIIKANCP